MTLTDKNKAEIFQLLDIVVRELVVDFRLIVPIFSDGKEYAIFTAYFNGLGNTSYGDYITTAMLSHPKRSYLIAQKINEMVKKDLPEEYQEMMDKIAFNDKLNESMPDKPTKEKRIKI